MADLFTLDDYPLEPGDLDSLTEDEKKFAERYPPGNQSFLALVKAVAFFGSPAGLADALTNGQTRNTAIVNNWLTTGRTIPPERAAQIEQLTKGAITRSELRPDLFGYLPYELDELE